MEQVIVNLDDVRIGNAVVHGKEMLESYRNLRKAEIIEVVNALPPHDLIDLLLYVSEVTASGLPMDTDAQATAMTLHMCARHFIYEPSAYHEEGMLDQRLPIFRTMAAAYAIALVGKQVG